MDKERIADLRERATTGGPTKAWRRSDYIDLLDALEAALARAEGAEAKIAELKEEELRLHMKALRAREVATQEAAEGILQARACRISPVRFGEDHPHADDTAAVLIGNIWHDADDVREAARKLGMVEPRP